MSIGVSRTGKSSRLCTGANISRDRTQHITWCAISRSIFLNVRRYVVHMFGISDLYFGKCFWCKRKTQVKNFALFWRSVCCMHSFEIFWNGSSAHLCVLTMFLPIQRIFEQVAYVHCIGKISLAFIYKYNGRLHNECTNIWYPLSVSPNSYGAFGCICNFGRHRKSNLRTVGVSSKMEI